MPPFLTAIRSTDLRRVLLVLGITCLQACSEIYYELGRPVSGADILASDGRQQLSEVLEQLGPPFRVTALDGGFALAWEHWRIKEQAIGISLGPLGFDLLALDWGNARVAGDFLLVTFDREHRVSGVSFSRRDEELASGRALQPSVGIVDLVETGDLVRPMPQHRWGAKSLQLPARSLNTASDPDSGRAGLEQRGTPPGVGQRTLEFED